MVEPDRLGTHFVRP